MLIVGVAVWAYWPVSDIAKRTEPVAGQPAKTSGKEVKYKIKFSPHLYMPGTIPHGVGKPLEQLSRAAERFSEIYPDTEIEFINVPSTIREWLVTQLSAGTAPDIFYANVHEIMQDVQKGWYIPLDRFLSQPNPFVPAGAPGSRQWWDSFKYEAITKGKAAPDGKTYCISFDMVETGVFYNKTIFSKLGLAPPGSWNEFLAMMSKLKENGYTPLIADDRGCFAGWGVDLVFDQLYDGILPGIDVKHDLVREKYMQGYLDWDEIGFLYQKGFFRPTDKRWVQLWRILKELRQYCPNDLMSVNVNIVKLFISQQGAMLWFDTRVVQGLARDPDLGFDWGVFYMPAITKDYCKYASGTPMCVVGGSAMQYVVSNSAIRDTGNIETSQRLKRCIAFLQFITTPANNEAIVNEVVTYLPNVKGTTPHKELLPFDAFLQRRYTMIKWTATFDLRFNEILERTLLLYLNDDISEEEFLGWMDKNLFSAIESTARRKGVDYSDMQRQWDQLAPLREKMEDMPNDAR